MKKIESIRDYWNNRAGLGKWAGTQDLIAKELELRTIAEFVRPGMRILDAGCGNGITAIELARHFPVEITAFDYSPEMVEAARQKASTESLVGSICFRIGDVTDVGNLPRDFDFIYTERVLINLPDWETQKRAITQLTGLLRPVGTYAMVENSQDGLNNLNALREHAGLKPIVPPWHNRYFRDAELETLSLAGVTLERVILHTSTYYVLSRVVNAWLASREGREPDYNSPINELALQLPAIGDFGQGRVWVWKRLRTT